MVIKAFHKSRGAHKIMILSKFAQLFQLVGYWKEETWQRAAGRTTPSSEQWWSLWNWVLIGSMVGRFTTRGKLPEAQHCPGPHPECWTCSGWSPWPGRRRSPAASPRRVCCPRKHPPRGSSASRICRQDAQDLLQQSALQLSTQCVNGVTDKTQTSEVLPPTSSHTTKGALGFYPL